MSSEAITQNDLREILSRTVGSVPSEYKKLLWSNPSPTSAFNAQTISLDFSNYDAIEIIIRVDTANTYTLAPIVVEVGKGGIAFNSTAYNSVRQFTTTASGITFTGATYYSAYGNWSTTSTNALIPQKIYGIKYERVDPPQVDASDYVIEQGTDGIWTYRKWNSGVSECWGVVNTSTAFTAWSSPIYYGSTYSARQTFPANLFVDVPNEQVAMRAGGADIWVGTDSTNRTSATQTGRYYPLRVGSGSTITFTTQFYCVGRWK